jgi:hypothetical protein
MALSDDLLGAFEVHSPDELRRLLASGASATEPINGKLPMACLIEAYLRSPRFPECVRILRDAGAVIDDPLLEAVLLDDAKAIRELANRPGADLSRRLSIVGAYTSCAGVTALHLAAEFNALESARALIDLGVDVNARAATDDQGFGGQTPIFHTVNSVLNFCRPAMELLVEKGADLTVRVDGVVWGGGFDWETIVLDVTPLSYAQCGLYPQFHRREADVYDNLAVLYAKRYGRKLDVKNVPNRYLTPAR